MSERDISERKPYWRYAVVPVPLILGLGMISGWVSNSGYGNDWFDALQKPGFMPPGWAFGAAWTTLYVLLGLAVAFILQAKGAPGRRIALALFTAQMLLNFSWSPAFFGMHLIAPALFIIVLMLALAIAATFVFARIRQAAAWLMMPYLGWLAFASSLNYAILRLNPGA